MARLSKIDRLPAEIRDAIADQRRNGRTIDEILAHIRSLGVPEDAVGRSGLGAHIQELDEIADLARRDRAMAEVLVERGIGDDDNRLARANVELMHGQVFRLSLAARRNEGAALDAKEAKLISETLRNLASAAKLDVERIEKVKRALAEEARKRVEKIADDVASAKGPVDPLEILRRVREDIYGMYDT